MIIIDPPDQPITVACPRCGSEQADYGGFGAIHCRTCGHCPHPSSTLGVCDLCGEWVNVRTWPMTVHLTAYSEAEWERMRYLAAWKPCTPPSTMTRDEQLTAIANSRRDRDGRPHIDVEPMTTEELWLNRDWHYLLIRQGLKSQREGTTDEHR